MSNRFEVRSDGSGHTAEKWLVAESLDGRRLYLVHGHRPRFVARIFEEDDPADVLDSLSYRLPTGESLAGFVWLDAVDWQTHPVEPELLDLLKRAGEAVAAYDERLDAAVNLDAEDDL